MGACIGAEVKGILCFGMGLTLREGNREYFYQKLDEHFPGLKERYIRIFGERYECPSPRQAELMGIFRDTCEKHGILQRSDAIFQYLNEF